MSADPAAAQAARPTHRHEAHGFGVYGGLARLTAGPPVDPQVVAGFVDGFLRALADECLGRGADLVGHLKVHLSAAGGTVRASLVDPEAGPALAGGPLGGVPFAGGELVVNAVVHGLADEDVAAAVFAAARVAAAAHGLAVEWQETHVHRGE
ncbi:MAG: hypothetical protein ACE5H9_14830 [Anaerolineae bacterium]